MNIINLTRQKGLAVLATAAMLFSLLWSASPVLAAPAVPVITTPSQSTTTDPIMLTGTADANVGITVTGGESTAMATSSASGDWSVMVDLNDESLNVLSAVAIDAVGSTSAAATVEITHTATSTADVTDPVFDPVADISATTTASAGATVNFTVTATDDTDASVTVVCTPASGSTFPVGTTTVTCTAEDDAGNIATTTFDVVVDLIDLPAVDVDLDIDGPFCSADATITLTGTTDTGSTVLIVGASGTTTATLVDGEWSVDLDLTATSSVNTFDVVVLDAGGDVIVSEEIDITYDVTAPEITLVGDATFNVPEGTVDFADIDPGVMVTDDLDATVSVATSSNIDLTVDGTYTVVYTVTDCAGNTDVVTRTVVVDLDDSGSDNDANNDDDDDDNANRDDDDDDSAADDDDDDTFIGGTSTFPNIISLTGTPLFLPQVVTTPAPQVLGASVAYVPGMPSTGADVSETAKMALLLSGVLALGMYLTASKRKIA